MKILQLRAENVKRLSIVEITPDGHIVEITGANGEGKTSVLDAIMMALGGADAAPGVPIRKGKNTARIDLKLGDKDGVKLTVERTITAKGNYITVKGADGAKFGSPQKMMNDLMGAVGFDPLAFMRMKPKEQFEMLRGLVKLDVDLDALDRKRATIFEERTQVGRDLDSAKARAAAINVPDDLPDEAPDRAAIVERLTNASAHNETVRLDTERRTRAHTARADAAAEVVRLERELEQARTIVVQWDTECDKIDAEPAPQPVDVVEVRAELERADRLAEGFRRQQAKIDAEAEALTFERRWDEKTDAIKAIDEQKSAALAGAKMPIEGLSFADGVVSFKGIPLDQASAAEQLRVSAAIGAALNPKLRVILARDGSLLDSKSLKALGEFAEANDMQVWVERVDESGAVGIVMEDGHVKGQEALVAEQAKAEAEGREPGGVEKETAAAQDPGGDAEQRARAFLAAQIAALPTYTNAEQCELANAQVKVKLKRFPNLISTEWAPKYLEVMKRFTKKK